MRARSLRRIVFGSVLAAAVFSPTSARAQIAVIDAGAIAQLVIQVGRALQQLRTAQLQLQQQIIALRKLPNPSWRQINGALAQIDALMQQGRSLAYSLNAIDAEFRNTFPGQQVFANYLVDERTQAERTLATLRGALNAANRTAKEFPTTIARLQAMKGQLAAIQGHEGALELNGTIGVLSVEELTLLRQELASLTNVQAVYYARQVNAEAQRDTSIRAKIAGNVIAAPRQPPSRLVVIP